MAAMLLGLADGATTRNRRYQSQARLSAVIGYYEGDTLIYPVISHAPA
jgi:hypothetical protein